LKARLIFMASVIAVFAGVANTWLAAHDGGGF
jgi:hypothetical protein